MRENRTLPVPDGLVGERVDTALARMLGLSRSVVASLAEQGDVTVGGVAVPKSFRLTEGAWISVEMPAAPSVEIEETPVEGFDILYEDTDIIVIDKPVGVAAHASPGWEGPTVLGALRAAGRRVSTSGAAERQGIVHRLDVGTSGVMVVARSELAYSVLKRAFKARTVSKGYHALVQGHPDPLVGTIEAPIGRDNRHAWKMAVMEGGKHAVTHYDTLEVMVGATLLDIDLETGRTHQIRVHMSALHHPCVGDITYGADPRLADRLGLERQWLHAVRLKFIHPGTGSEVEFESPYPEDLARALEMMREGTR